MGYVSAADIMMNVTTSFATQALATDNIDVFDTYIDNILFIGDEDTLRRIQSRWITICQTHNITCGEMEISSRFTYRGVEIDLHNKTYNIKRSFAAKLERHCEFILQREKITLQQLATTIGEMSYADSILQHTPFRDFYCSFHLWTQAEQERKRTIVVPPALRSELRKVLTWIHTTKTLNQHMTNLSTLAYTDASFQAGGKAIFHNDGFAQYTSYRWNTKPRSAPQAELHMAVRYIRESAREAHTLNLASDCTPALRCLQRRYSSSLLMFQELKSLPQVFNFSVFLFYVEGRWNPADAPSRLVTQLRTVQYPPPNTLHYYGVTLPPGYRPATQNSKHMG